MRTIPMASNQFMHLRLSSFFLKNNCIQVRFKEIHQIMMKTTQIVAIESRV